MKKILFVFLALVVTLLLVGCGEVVEYSGASDGSVKSDASSVASVGQDVSSVESGEGDDGTGASNSDTDVNGSVDSDGKDTSATDSDTGAEDSAVDSSELSGADSSEKDEGKDEEDGKGEETEYSFELTLDENASLGLLSGVITQKPSGEKYELYFGNESGMLEGYTKIGEGEGDFTLEGVVVPPEATRVIILVGEDEFFVEIPEECLLFGKDAFIFGVLSDVHYNKYYSDGENDDALFAFDNALDYFDKIGVQMVGVTGDLSNDGEESALINYSEAISGRDYPVFAVVGNHDMPAYKNGYWAQHITANIENCEFSSGREPDFIYKPQGEDGDVFIFLNLTRWSYSDKSLRVISNPQLEWLEEKLEQYKDRQVYLFFHLFLCGPDGEKHTGVGNIMNPGGYTYPLPYQYANADERWFRALMRDYKNVVYFSGHSHWMFEMEIYGDWLNYSNFDGEYCHMVHVPSVTEPRWIGENDTNRTGMHGQSSQGIVMYDYGDISVLVPIDFITGTIFTEYMEIIK